MSEFTREDIRMLAQCERDMDSGKQMFVVLGGSRMALTSECAEALGLVSGQTINALIFEAMLRWQIADLEAKIEERKFREANLPGDR